MLQPKSKSKSKSKSKWREGFSVAEIGANFLANLSDRDLILETKAAVRTERESTAVVVRYFREINDRELFLKHACSSLFQFATEKLGYCAASAQARINAMRLIEAVPQVEKKIESGELSLTAAAKVQTFFQAEQKENKSYSIEQKLEVINECLSKSTREVDRELASRNPDVAKIEYVKPVGRDRFQISFSISEEAEEKMKRLKGLFAHSIPNMSTEELFEKLLELGLEKFDPVRKAERSNRLADKKAAFRAREIKATPHDGKLHLGGVRGFSQSRSSNVQNVTCTNAEEDQNAVYVIADEEPNAKRPVAEEKSSNFELMCSAKWRASIPKRSRYIPARTKHKVWLRNAGGGCEHVSDQGERCGEVRALQIDHIHGVARGGSHNALNLRVLCAKHNRAEWKAKFYS